MNNAPPIISLPVMPPPLPPGAVDPALRRYVRRCMVLCIVVASVGALAILGSIVQYFEEGAIKWDVLGFAVWLAFIGSAAAWLLHKQKRGAYLATVLCLLVMLLAIPVGTVFGILGLTWLNKAQGCLDR